MTLRAKPVARRRSRAGWDPGDRRNSLINAGFILAIVASILILVGYGAWSWFDDHFGAAATVNGTTITKDDLRARLTIENFRLDYIESRIQTLMAKGRISTSDGQQQIAFIQQRRDQLTSLALERLVDIQLMGQLAAERSLEASEADIDQQLIDEATTAEQRHVWVIEVEPDVDPATGEVGDEQKQAAKAKADAALARLKAGESWDVVAKEVSTSGLAPQAGDLGWLSKDSGYDDPFMTAVFAAELNAPTAVVTGDDDIDRIGRYTEVAPQEIDGGYQDAIEAAGIALADYRAAARADVLRQKLSDSVVADMSKPSLQRHVLEIYLPTPNASLVGVERGVKVRQIVYAPNDDQTTAEDLAPDDPAWAAAKAEADAAYAQLKANPDKFDELARAQTDEPVSRTKGGKQPWYYATSQIDEAVKNAILDDTLEPGELLPPVQSTFAWHVIQYLRDSSESDGAFLSRLMTEATDEATFRQLARDNSEAPAAADGGDLGWIAMGQLTDQLDTAIFGTTVGSNSDVIPIAGDGTYLLRILAEETREPTAEQLRIVENSGFQYWYTRQKEAADISYDLGTTTVAG